MKKLFPSILLIVLSFSVLSQTQQAIKSNKLEVRWDLQVTDPNFELKNHKLDIKQYKPYLSKTSWRCHASKVDDKGHIQLRKLHCDYSVEKTGTVTTIVSCSRDRNYGEGNLTIYDERKDLTFQIMLTCRVQ